jgi:hypothetical protein
MRGKCLLVVTEEHGADRRGVCVLPLVLLRRIDRMVYITAASTSTLPPLRATVAHGNSKLGRKAIFIVLPNKIQ